MYSGVPMATSASAWPASSGSASPKSVTTARMPRDSSVATRNSTLLLLKSRWMTPDSCAAVSAAAICVTMRAASSSRSRPRPRRCASVGPSMSSMVRKSSGSDRAAIAGREGVLPEIEDAADVRMRDLARELDLGAEALDAAVVEQIGDEGLERDLLAERLVEGGVDLAHAAGGEKVEDAIAIGEALAGRQHGHGRPPAIRRRCLPLTVARAAAMGASAGSSGFGLVTVLAHSSYHAPARLRAG